MSDILLDNQSPPATPAAGKSILMVDSTTKKMASLDDGGVLRGMLSRNFSAASQLLGVGDTYVTNSGLLIPSCGLVAGMTLTWLLAGSKTAAGVATANYIVRIGPNQSTADAAIITLVAVAQTAVADNGLLVVTAVLRNAGAAAIMAAVAAWAKTQTGLIGFGGSIDGVSAGFDSTGRAGQFIGLSINAGAASAWTLTSAQAELDS